MDQGSNTSLQNIAGKLLVPGFIDSHMHLLNYGYSLQVVNLANCRSVEEVITTFKKFISMNNLDDKGQPNGIFTELLNYSILLALANSFNKLISLSGSFVIKPSTSILISASISSLSSIVNG